MAENEFYLDWERDTLQVWELDKSGLVIEAMREGIRLGHKFPAINVVEVDDNFYRLAPGEMNLWGYYDGGHYRSVSHHLEGVRLLCTLVENIGSAPTCYRDVGVVGISSSINKSKLKDSLSYLPDNVVREFCKKHKLRSEYFLSQ